MSGNRGQDELFSLPVETTSTGFQIGFRTRSLDSREVLRRNNHATGTKEIKEADAQSSELMDLRWKYWWAR